MPTDQQAEYDKCKAAIDAIALVRSSHGSAASGSAIIDDVLKCLNSSLFAANVAVALRASLNNHEVKMMPRGQGEPHLGSLF